MTQPQHPRPSITVTYDESTRGIALWIQARPDGPKAPILLDADEAHRLVAALHAAIDDRDRLRAHLGEIAEADPDDFRG